MITAFFFRPAQWAGHFGLISFFCVAMFLIAPLCTEAALTEDFDGASLPAGWSFVDPNTSGATSSVSDSVVEITIPSGQDTDTIFSVGSTDKSVGITHAVEPGDFDIAVQLDTDITQFEDIAVNLFFFDDTTASGSRFSIYTNSNPRDYSYARAGGAGGAVGPTIFNDYFRGLPAWLRVTYASTTGVWTFYGSTDGYTWDQILQNTRAFEAETFKISFSSFSSQPGVTAQINKVVDVIEYGSTDLRESIDEDYARTTIVSFDGSDGVLPDGLSDDSANTGSTTWTGSALRLGIDMNTDGSRARLQYTGTTTENGGTLVQFQFPSFSTDRYAVFGIGRDTGGIDQYVRGPGYAWEVNASTNRRLVRVDEPGTVNVDFNDQYTFISDGSDIDLGGAPGPISWARVERVDGRIRARIWGDGEVEPSTWNFDGQDEIVNGPYGPVLGLSHNDGTTGSYEYMDVHSFEFYEITEPDTIDPSVSLTAPSIGAEVSGASVDLTANATDDIAVAGVRFYIDDTLIGSEVTATSAADTYSTTFDSTVVSDGSYSLRAVARDTSNNYATSSAVSITVANDAEEVAPSGGNSSSLRSRASRPGQAQIDSEASRLTSLFDQLQEVADMIERLRERIKDLTSQNPGAMNSAIQSLPTRAVGYGAEGTDVQQLQRVLNARGFIIATSGPGSPGNESMYFGSQTVAALARYQRTHGIIPAEGYFGPLTRTHMLINN